MRLGAAAVALALVVAACGGDGDSGESSSPSGKATTPLVGTNWMLTAGSSLDVPSTGASVTARFATDTVSGEAPCNAYSAGYEVDGATMRIDSRIRTTLVACSGSADTLERAYLARLPDVATYAIAGTTLRLFGAQKRLLLEYRASVGAKEIVGDWIATGYYTGNAIESVAPGSTLTANFTASDVSGEGGCNAFSGSYRAQGTSITIGPLAATLRACADPTLDTQEQRYLAALQLAATFQVSGSQLQLFRADGGIAATFESAPRR